MVLPEGGTQETTLYNAKGIYEICRWSRQPKADAFMDWVWDVLESIRTTGSYGNFTKTDYPPKASSVSEIVQLGRFIRQLMKDQQATPYEVAEVVIDTMRQFGINLHDKMLLPARLEKVKDDELDMVEFACTFPNSSYQDYLLYRTMIKVSR